MEPPPLTSRRMLRGWTLRILREYSVHPRRRYSQNFIIDPLLIEKVIKNTKNKSMKNESIVELGSGLGTLSYFLSRIPNIDYTVHYEIDPILCSVSNKLISSKGVLVCSDGLKHRWTSTIFVSNIPYAVTSDVIVKLSRSNNIRKAVIIVQSDVATRLKAKPGTHEYGRITVLTQILFEIRGGYVFHPSSFYPPPRVYSELLILERIREYDELIRVLEDFTRIIFNQRRRLAYTVIRRSYGSEGCRVLKDLGVEKEKRVFQLSPSKILEIVHAMRKLGLI
jgi:16S rRNA (adenine1518-N6/adenine1519-N6)-dimethyltransferase